jgi:hypothetical protein
MTRDEADRALAIAKRAAEIGDKAACHYWINRAARLWHGVTPRQIDQAREPLTNPKPKGRP